MAITNVINFRSKPLPQGHIWVGKLRNGSTGFYANKHSAGLNKCPECSRFGLKKTHTPAQSIELYKISFFEAVASDEEYRSTVIKLRGRPLVCGCTQKKECDAGLCNGKVIASFLDSLPSIVTEEELVGAARAELARLAALAVEEADR